MEKGLDDLIESLLSEIAFSGTRGCSVSHLVGVIDSFYPESQDKQHHGQLDISAVLDPAIQRLEKSGNQHAEKPCLGSTSKIWGWLVSRTDVSVGPDRQCNHMTLEQVLAIPEPSEDAKQAEKATPAPATPSSTKKRKRPPSPPGEKGVPETPRVRPYVFVSEERQWKTLAGHGPDPKRLPQFEWKALVDIASVRETGILQGDLVRLTGQDKRSLPNRTDALARKGYIIKQPVLLRGSRTSKMWLAIFADNARQEARREGLPYDELDLSSETLARDLTPVSFDKCWNGGNLDYLAIAQAFIAVTKAWGVIRYSDLRTKLNVEGRVPQMRALAKTSRWLTELGSVAFVPATFPNSTKLYRDCVKFFREPTAKEWKQFRSIPRNAMIVPSQRIGKRGENSRARAKEKGANAAQKSARPKVSSVKDARAGPSMEEQAEVLSSNEFAPHLRALQKPLPASVFDIIRRTGKAGTSNPDITNQTFGHHYRKYIAALTASMAAPRSHLADQKETQVSSQLTRIGKTMMYKLFAPHFSGRSEDSPVEPSGANDPPKLDTTDNLATEKPVLDVYGFAQPKSSDFGASPTSTPSEIAQRKTSPPEPNSLHRIRGKRGDDVANTLPVGKHSAKRLTNAVPVTPISSARPTPSPSPSSEEARESSPAAATEDSVIQEHTEGGPTSVSTEENESDQRESTPAETKNVCLEPIEPGVFRGLDNSLDPPGKKGRRRKSLVLIFRSEALRLKAALSSSSMSSSTHEKSALQTPVKSDGQPSKPAPATEERSVATIGPELQDSAQQTSSALSKARRGGGGPFQCETCGNTWKGSNGLEYHQTKSRTACNPSFREEMERAQQHKPGQHRRSRNDSAQDGSDLPRRSRLLAEKFRSQAHPKNDSVRPSRKRTSFQSPADTAQIIATPIPPYIKPRSSIKLRDVPLHGVMHPQASQPIPSSSELNLSSSPLKKRARPSTAEPVSPARPANTASTRPMTLDKEVSCDNRHMSEQSSKGHGNNNPFHMPEDSLEQVCISIGTAVPQEENAVGPGKGQASDTKARKERISEIIKGLLDQNHGVFPGDLSLFLVIASIWTERHGDIDPPDKKIYNTVLNSLEKSGDVSQVHFLFLDQHGKSQNISVVVKIQSPGANITGLPTDPRVVSIKEKAKELFPEAYIPDRFSLAERDPNYLDTLMSRYWGRSRPSAGRGRQQTLENASTSKLEVLQYPSSVISHITREDRNSHVGPGSRTPSVKLSSPSRSALPKRSNDQGRTPLSRATTKSIQYAPGSQNDTSQFAHQDELSQHAALHGAPGYGPSFEENPDSFSQSFPSGDASFYDEDLEAQSAAFSHQQEQYEANARTEARKRKAIEPIDPILLAAESVLQNHDKHRQKKARQVDGHSNKRTPTLQERRYATPDTVHSQTNDNGTFADRFVETRYAGNEFAPAGEGYKEIQFSEVQSLEAMNRGSWPSLPETFFEGENTSLHLQATLPSTTWFLSQNLPQSVAEVLEATKRQVRPGKWTDKDYGSFVHQANAIRTWELSTEGRQIMSSGSTAPEHVFLNLSSNPSQSNMKPVDPEWPNGTQYTAGNLSAEIKDCSPEDADYGFCLASANFGQLVHTGNEQTTRARRAGKSHGNLQSRTNRASLAEDNGNGALPSPASSNQDMGYKTRTLSALPPGKQGRANRQKISESLSGFTGSASENELIATFIVFKTLLGGVGSLPDYARILKLYPELSLSGLKKFWPKVSRQRKRYIEVLTEKFQSAFLESYEKGEFPPLNYEDLDDYDWPVLIKWTTKLESHQDVELPTTRAVLEHDYELENPDDDVIYWQEVWYSTSAVHARFTANVSTPASVAVQAAQRSFEKKELARSWIRALCCTSLKGAGVVERVGQKLLQLGNGDQAQTNRVLRDMVGRLTDEKTITKTKNKSIAHAIRLNHVYANQIKKYSEAGKMAEAVAFKAELDRSFRASGQCLLPYNANDGTIMAMLNLQACQRVHAEACNYRSIPFGFQPGCYEGRLLSKDNYRFDIRISPTDDYMYDEDMPLLSQVAKMEIPKEGHHGEIPIWADLLGNVDKERWLDYVTAVGFAAATKGPLTPHGASVVLKPVVEPFEAQLVIEFLDRLGVLERYTETEGVVAAEWWWLVMGHLLKEETKVDE